MLSVYEPINQLGYDKEHPIVDYRVNPNATRVPETLRWFSLGPGLFEVKSMAIAAPWPNQTKKQLQ